MFIKKAQTKVKFDVCKKLTSLYHVHETGLRSISECKEEEEYAYQTFV